MNPESAGIFAQILPILYIAVHFTIKGLTKLKAITVIYAAVTEILLLFNITTGEKPEPILNWLSFIVMTAMMITLAAGAFKTLNDETDRNNGKKSITD